MSLRKLHKPQAFERPEGISWDAPADVLARWAERPLAAETDDDNTISIYDVIGEDWWTGGGFTAKRMSAALRSIGPNDVTVKINSPGGDVFEGLTIYNQLAEHPAKVTVEVMGIAASAASVIAMAADDLSMNLGTFLMVHNAWGVVVGNRHDLRVSADVLESIDGAMSEIYDARANIDKKAIAALMDGETYLTASDAVEKGFADRVTNHKSVPAPEAKQNSAVQAKRQLDAILAGASIPRSERRRLLKDATGTRNAAEEVTHDAGFNAAALRLLETLRS